MCKLSANSERERERERERETQRDTERERPGDPSLSWHGMALL